MRISSQLLLTFLLNAIWQVALIAALAALGSWLLRNSVARYRHWLWVGALCLAFIVPAVTSSRTLFETDVQPERRPSPAHRSRLFRLKQRHRLFPKPAQPFFRRHFSLNQTLGFALLGIYFGFLLYRIFKLIQAWHTTRSIRRHAVELEPDDESSPKSFAVANSNSELARAR